MTCPVSVAKMRITSAFDMHEEPLKLIAMVHHLANPNKEEFDRGIAFGREFHLKVADEPSCSCFQWQTAPKSIFGTLRLFGRLSSAWQGQLRWVPSTGGPASRSLFAAIANGCLAKARPPRLRGQTPYLG